MDAGPGREPEGEVSRTRKRVGGLARPSQGAMSGIESLVTNFPFVYSTDVCLLFTEARARPWCSREERHCP